MPTRDRRFSHGTGSVEGIVSEPPASEKAKTTGRLGISAMTPSAKLRFRTQARTCLGSALEGNKAPESRIGETVLSSFDVTRKLVFEIRVSPNPYDEVVPTKELIQHQPF